MYQEGPEVTQGVKGIDTGEAPKVLKEYIRLDTPTKDEISTLNFGRPFDKTFHARNPLVQTPSSAALLA